MPFTIPDESEAAFAPQARLFQTDLETLALAHNGTGVLSGCAVTAQGSPDMTVAVAAGCSTRSLAATPRSRPPTGRTHGLTWSW